MNTPFDIYTADNLVNDMTFMCLCKIKWSYKTNQVSLSPSIYQSTMIANSGSDSFPSDQTVKLTHNVQTCNYVQHSQIEQSQLPSITTDELPIHVNRSKTFNCDIVQKFKLECQIYILDNSSTSKFSLGTGHRNDSYPKLSPRPHSS